jgi:SAM-dependent methyltransferase
VGNSVPAQYFIDLYRREVDPWQFESSEYERAKYAATLRALPRQRYANALELACSIGVFTCMLADRTDALLAVDVSPEALERARRNCAEHTNVRFEQRTMPHEYPHGHFDLTTVCEVGFYLDPADLIALREHVIVHSVAGAHIVLVHWTPRVRGHATTTEEVHEAFRAAPELRHLHGFSEQTYRLDVLERLTDA